tara:strand:+ start:3026 stop:4159 length:1134 start_codon:yes stop_codon:yes gene_type:complete
LKSKKINIVIGGTFHLPMLHRKLTDLGHDLKIYTSTPKFKFKNDELKKNIVFIPMFFQIIKKLYGYNLSPWMKQFDNFLFDKITSLIMRRADILYGFAGCSLICGNKIKKNGGKYYLDRACPHIEYQNNILIKESKKCDIRFFSANSKILKRCLSEYLKADKIITPSSYTQNTFLNRGFDKSKVCIAPLIGKKEVHNLKIKKIDETDQITFAFIGENLLRKGLLYLLEAWKKLDKNDHKLIIRSNSLDIHHNSKIKNLLDQKGIIIKEYYKDINDFYDEADVLCLPSIDEGFGMVVLEAMSNGVPSIISKNVGASDLISDKENGIIVNTGNTDDIYQAINYFINNKTEIYRYGVQAYNDLQNIMKEDLYKESLRKII